MARDGEFHMTGPHVFDEVLAVCALYRDRHHEWPTQVRLDSARLQALARLCTTESFASLAAHVRLAVRDSPGVSAGGRSVVQLTGAPPGSSTELARTWLGGIELARQASFSAHLDYWQRLAEQTTTKFTEEDVLGVEHMVLAHDLGPDRLESTDEERRREELLFYAVYIASFGIHGVHPKTLAMVRRTYGWSPSELSEFVVMLHLDDGRIVMTDAPWDALSAFPIDRSSYNTAVMDFAHAMTDLARKLAG
ncbi:MAG: hypothetical protein ACXVUE_12695 [Solirubrobacteraceae bacterium]